MRVEYDFDQMAGGVRGKYAAAWEGRTPAMSLTGIAPPIFEEQAGAVYVTFRAAVGPTERRGAVEVTLGARAQRILSILENRSPLGSSALLRELGEKVSQRALQTELARLREEGLISSSGKGRATTYQVRQGGSRR
jgi:DNA-binding transcriptional ArsR family regulator